MTRRSGWIAAGALFLCVSVGASWGNAQRPPRTAGPVLGGMGGMPGAAAPMRGATQVPPGAKPDGRPRGETPGSPRNKEEDRQGKGRQPGADAGKPGEKGAESKVPATIKRTDKTPTPADPKELLARLGPDGIVTFQFRGQNWPDVLDWYAQITGVSVDWQELPGDYLNISTQRGYTVKELGVLLNRLLLARGFTMLPQGEFINVVKCQELNVALVPRVQPEDLSRLSEYDFVRVMFELDWLLASDAVTELTPLMSNNGKLFPLKTTNRIEAMDTVCNLRAVYRLLMEEQQSDSSEPRLVQEFVLQFARAEEVRDSLSQFLGIGAGARPQMPGMSSKQMAQLQQQQQQMMQMQQQMAAKQRSSSSKGKGAMPSMPTKEDPVRMMVNRRRNSILVQAPPDKMATIAQAIKLLDVREQGATSLQAFLGRMQVYRLAQLDPKKLVESLQQLGGLDPTTRLEVDEVNRAIIAYGSPADHHTIRMTVEKLDGSARRVEVIPLRRLAADEVAGTIQYLMSGASEQDSTRSDYYMGYSSYRYGSQRSRSETSTDQFRIDADVANNRLLVKANDVELEEVVNILVKLGEVPQLGRSRDMTRVLDITPGADAAAFLQRLQRDFKVLAPNQLVLPEIESEREAQPGPKSPAPPAEQEAEPIDVESPAKTALLPRGLYQPALFQRSADPLQEPQEPAREIPTVPRSVAPRDDPGKSEGSPIVVSIGPDGRLVLASRDLQALDMLEQLAARTAPPTKDYEVFRLKNAPASWVVLNLQDFFEEEDEAERRRRDRMTMMYYGPRYTSQSDDESRLSNRRPLKFISDLDTNTILVQGADSQQLKTIADLIELYDVPEPVNTQNARVTKLFPIQYSKAGIIAATIKNVYRDLLSSNDPALQQGAKDQGKQSRSSGMTVISAFGFGEESTPTDSRTSARFEGKLSIGIDEISNTMLVSTEGENLMQVIEDMIRALDAAAKPVSDVRVIQLSRHVDGTRLQQVLDKVLNDQGRPQQATPAQPQPGQPTSGENVRGRPAQPPAAAPSRRR